MENDNLVKTTWRIPADLYEELKEASVHGGTSINAIATDRLRAASVRARFDKVDRELSALKKMMREMLDQIELK